MVPRFEVVSPFRPSGDQPEAISALVNGAERGDRYQTLLGITGSGKTATIAWTIEALQRPTLIIEPNKSLAAQLASELKDFFPHNRVEYFVSYYDYYQPEAYLPTTDTYIEKDSSINDEIDRLRHATTSSLLLRRDVIGVVVRACTRLVAFHHRHGSVFRRLGNRVLPLREVNDFVRAVCKRVDLALECFRSFRLQPFATGTDPAFVDDIERRGILGFTLRLLLTNLGCSG